MNPFDQPPVGPPVSADESIGTRMDPPGVPGHGGHDGPRRGRMAIAALAAAGLVGGGIVVAGQFASADRPSLDSPAAIDEDTGDDDAGDEDTGDDDTGNDGTPSFDGEIVIDDGDGEPLVLDLGELGECIGPILRGPLFEGRGDGRPLFDDEFHERMERFLDDLPWDELGDLDGALDDDGVRIFGSGGSMITVVGPDGVQMIDLGDGDATVTIEQRDGELSIDADGDATVNEFPDLGAFLPEMGDQTPDGRLPSELDRLDLDELLPFDLDGIESCLDDLDGSGSAGS